MAKKFSIVDFEDTVAVVSSGWLIKETDSDLCEHCFWPPRSAKDQRSLLTEHAQPDPDTWIRYKVKTVLKSTDSFKKANVYCLKAMHTDKITTDEEVPSKGQKKVVDNSKDDQRETSLKSNKENDGSDDRISVLSELSEDSDDDDNANNAVEQQARAQSSKVPTETGLINESVVGRSRYDRNESSSSVQPTPHSASTPSTKDSGLADTLKSIDRRLSAIEGLLSRSQSNLLCQDDPTEEYMLDPCSSKEELQAFDLKLDRSQSERARFTAYLRTIGGNNLQNVTNRIMKRVAQNDVWEQYTLHGTGKKSAFDSTRVFQGIGRAIKKMGYKEADIEMQVASILRHAPRQKGGSLFNQKDCTTKNPKRRRRLDESDSN